MLNINQQSKINQMKTIVIGIDLGNTLISFYFNQEIYSIKNQLLIDRNNHQITIGRQVTSLHKKLENKQNFLLENTLSNDSQESNIRQKSYFHYFFDILDLFVKSFTQRSSSTSERQKIIQQNALPSCFSYNGIKFREADLGSIQAILERGKKKKKNDDIVMRKPARIVFEDNFNLVQKTEEETIRLDQCLYLIFKSSIQEILSFHQNIKMNSINQALAIQLIINYYGFEGNSYLQSLLNLKEIFSLNNNFVKPLVSLIYTNTSLAIYFYVEYLKAISTVLKKSTIVSCLNFGSRGFSFSVYKLYPSSQKVIETFEHYSIEFGGVDITRILVDMIVDHIKLHKGVNIKSTAEMIQQLYKLAEQTKLSLTQTEQVFVRIEGYPLQQPYGFYLKRYNLEKRIQQKFNLILSQVKILWKKYSDMIEYAVLQGGTFNVPFFKKNFQDTVLKGQKVKIIQAKKNWISEGNYLWRSSGVIVLEKSQSQLTIKGDEEYFQCVLKKGQGLPVRFFKEIPFPRGELTYNLKFYENEIQIGKYVIQSKNLEWGQNLNFIVEKQQNKHFFVYSSKYLGEITMKGYKLCKPISLKEKVKLVIHFEKKITI